MAESSKLDNILYPNTANRFSISAPYGGHMMMSPPSGMSMRNGVSTFSHPVVGNKVTTAPECPYDC